LIREDFFSALSAPLRAPREKGNMIAAGRARPLPLPYQALALSVKSVVPLFLVAAGRIGHSLSKSSATK
jgi:hypothetical protein